ncbi:MAG: TonB-dependent receptor domain-containing protein, partial [Verrucomicrobiales bacterium]
IHADEPVQDLDPTVVDSEKEELFQLGKINTEDLEMIQATDLEDLFRNQPNVAVGGGATGGQKVYVRGLEDALLNVQVDGAVQTGTTFHHQSKFGVEPDLLKAAEVLPGVGRATDGPGALGGTLRFTTKDAADLLEPGVNFGGFVRSSYYTNTSGIKESISLYGNINEYLSFVGAFSYTNLDDYEDGDGVTLDETSSIQRNGFLKLSGDFKNGHTFSLSYEHYENGGPWGRRANIAGSLLGVVREPGTVIDLTRDTVIANYGFDAPDNEWLDLDFTAYYTENTSDFDYASPANLDENTKVQSLGFDLKNTASVGNHTVVVGSDFRTDDYQSTGWASIGNPALYSGDESAEVFGLYLQDDWQIIDQVMLTYGARFDHYDYTDQFGQNFEDSGFSPNATLIYSPNDCLSFHAGYSEAFRGVLPGEVYLIGSGPGVASPPSTYNSPYAQPEESENYEVGVDYDNGAFFAGGKLFHTTINNVLPIVANPRTNLGDLETEGYEILMGYRWNGLTARAAVSESNPTLNGTDIDVINGVASSSGRTWVASLDYDLPTYGVNLGYNVRYVEQLKNNVVLKQSYVVHGLYANWTPTFAQDFTVGLAVHNLFDKDYVDQASLTNGFGYQEPGRDVRLSATYRF